MRWKNQELTLGQAQFEMPNLYQSRNVIWPSAILVRSSREWSKREIES